MSKHTPGPWNVKIMRAGDDSWIEKICDSYGNTIRVIGLSLSSGEEAEANAQLIAAAPDLLEALIQVRELLVGIECTDYPVSEELDMVRAAIAKATKC